MTFRLLIACYMLSTSLVFAQGRAPAVEDFVGIEMDQHEATPKSNESLFNLENDLTKVHAHKNQTAPKMYQGPAPTNWSWPAIVGVIFAIGLPLMSWMMVLNHLKRQALSESASNIEVLEKYRKKREAQKNEDIRKAS